MWLETLGLRVVAEPENRQLGREPRLRFYTADGSPLPHAGEEAALRGRAEQEREQAWQGQLRAEQAQEQAERAREQAEQKHEQERVLRQEVERKLSALEARLAQSHGDNPPLTDDQELLST